MNASEEVILDSNVYFYTNIWPRMFRTYKKRLEIIGFCRFLMKIFRSNNSEIIAECRRYFQFNLPSELIEKKKIKFERNYDQCILVLRDM